jgi:hypothetical protein
VVSTNVGRSGVALCLAPSGILPGCIAVGTGSATPAATNTTLITESLRRVFSSTEKAAVYQVTYTGDFNAVEMSGLSLREFGTFESGTLGTKQCWQRDMFPVVTFDGTLELQIQVTFRIN